MKMITVRVPDEAADYLSSLSADTGLSTAKLVGMILATAKAEAWTVRVTRASSE